MCTVAKSVRPHRSDLGSFLRLHLVEVVGPLVRGREDAMRGFVGQASALGPLAPQAREQPYFPVRQKLSNNLMDNFPLRF
jgi:hypothetical protein